jgi:DNA-binding response OmpR family regulator
MTDKAKILLVEDHVPTAEMAKILLSRNGCDALVAHTGKEGIALALEFEFGLIILDIDLPDLTGFDILERLRQLPGTASTPIIFITGRSDKASWRRGLELGAVDYIQKPFEGPAFIRRIFSHLKISSQNKTKIPVAKDQK